jgi:YD repeat-containing protein
MYSQAGDRTEANNPASACQGAIDNYKEWYAGNEHINATYTIKYCASNFSGAGVCHFTQYVICQTVNGESCGNFYADVVASYTPIQWLECGEHSVGIEEGEKSLCYCDPGYMPAQGGGSACNAYNSVSHADKTRTKRPQACYGDPIVPMLGIHRQDISMPVALPRGLSLSLHYDSLGVLPLEKQIAAGYESEGNTKFSPLDLTSSVVGPHWQIASHRRYVEQDFLTVTPRINWGNGVEVNPLEFTLAFDFDAGAPLARGVTITDKKTGERSQFVRMTRGVRNSLAALTRFETSWVELKRDLPNGDSLSFSVDPNTGLMTSVVDKYGKTSYFDYLVVNNEIRLTRIVDTEGRDTKLDYYSNGILKSVTWPDATSREFLYEKSDLPGALTGVMDELQKRKSTFKYFDTGVAQSTEEGAGINKFSVSYQTEPVVKWSYGVDSTLTNSLPIGIQLTRPNGTTASLAGQIANQVPMLNSQSQPAGSGCLASTSQKMLDADGNVAWEEDFKGYRSCYAHDASRALQTVRVEGLASQSACNAVLSDGSTLPANARRVTTQWHPERQLESQVTLPRRKVTSIYNGQPDPFNGGAVASCADGSAVVVLCKRVEEATLDANGAQGGNAVIDTTVPARIQRWTYDQYGQVLTATDPLNNTTTNAYYSDTTADHTKGDLNTVTNAKQQVTTFTKYNAAGQWLEMKDANGVLTTRTFDLRQRVKSVSTAGVTTSYDYWPTGLLKQVTLPDASTVSYDYDDAHRLTSITDNLGNSVTYTLDNSGNRTGEVVKDPSGGLAKTLTRVPDALNRIQQVTGRE